MFPLTPPNQKNIGGCVPGIPGGVDASVANQIAGRHIKKEIYIFWPHRLI